MVIPVKEATSWSLNYPTVNCTPEPPWWSDVCLLHARPMNHFRHGSSYFSLNHTGMAKRDQLGFLNNSLDPKGTIFFGLLCKQVTNFYFSWKIIFWVFYISVCLLQLFLILALSQAFVIYILQLRWSWPLQGKGVNTTLQSRHLHYIMFNPLY